MIAVMFPFFFLATYEKDGVPAEKILLNIIRSRIVWAGRRPYKTENFYAIIEKEAKTSAAKNNGAKKTPGRK
jgi:hypothetical protein